MTLTLLGAGTSPAQLIVGDSGRAGRLILPPASADCRCVLGSVRWRLRATVITNIATISMKIKDITSP